MSTATAVREVFSGFAIMLFSYLEAFYRLFVSVKWKSVAGRTVLITGAGHGLGRQLALRLARERCLLILWDINESNNSKTARDAREIGAEVFSFEVDCSSASAVSECAQKVISKIGPVYMLINNAGILVGESILQLTEKDITRTMGINTMAHFWTIRSFLPAMLEANDGHIVSIASIAGKIGNHRVTDYCASKFAAVGIHEALTDEIDAVYEKPGVKTTVVCPLFINTGLIHSISTRFDGDKMLDTEAVVEEIVEGVLTNRKEILIPSISSNLVLILKSVLPERGWEAAKQIMQVKVPSQRN